MDWEFIKSNQELIETIIIFAGVYFFLRKAAKKDIDEIKKSILYLDSKIDNLEKNIDTKFYNLETNLKSEIRQTRIEFKIDELKRTGTEDKK